MSLKGGGGGNATPPEAKPMDPPPLAELPGAPYYTHAPDPGQTFNRGHMVQVSGQPLALAHGARPIDWSRSSMLAQQMPGLQDLLAKSFSGGQFANVAPPPKPQPQPAVVQQVTQPRLPMWQATSDYEIAMNDGIDPYPWRTDLARAREGR